MLGLAFGSLILTNSSDIYGRKRVLICCLILNSLILIPMIIFQDNFKVTIAMTFLFGMTTQCRYAVTYMHSTELSIKKNQEYFGAMCLLFDSSCSVWIGLYFYFIKLFNLSLIFLVVSQFIAILIYWKYVPESPRYLF